VYDKMNLTNTLVLATFMALGVMLVVGLAVIPAIDQAHARNPIASARNKGQQGFSSSGGQGGGCGSGFCG
jgi:hypothetical protein